jgi:hypothetical protein
MRLTGLLAALCALGAALVPGGAGAVTKAQSADDRYTLAGGCFGLRSKSLGRFVVKASGGGYAATAADAGSGEAIRMQATELGKYLMFGKDKDFVTADADRAQTATAPSDASEWEVTVVSGAFRIVSVPSGRALAVAPTGELVLGGDGDAALFTFESRQGCADYPEAGATSSPAVAWPSAPR